MRPERLVRFAAATFVVGLSVAACSSSAAAPNWTLVWSDEFNGTSLDTTKWKVDIGDSFGTGQEDYDTARPENLQVTGGKLVITARQESYAGAAYTSGRIETGPYFSQTYGKFEARIQLPTGQGVWPAFWMLGANYAEAGWPACGELDIMEMRGYAPGTVLGSMHGPGGADYSKAYTLDGGATFAEGFHVFSIEWQPGTVSWLVDGTVYETQSADLFPASQTWVFDHPFFILLDLALGGQFGGAVDSTTPLPQQMLVDYVRVYQNGPSTDGGSGG